MDAEWAATAGQFALGKAAGSQLDIAMPLYGTDFAVDRSQNAFGHTFVNYDEAIAAMKDTSGMMTARVERDNDRVVRPAKAGARQ